MTIDRRKFLVGAAAGLVAPAVAAAERRPCLVLVVVDDLLSVVHDREHYGPVVRTPALDSLMAEGVTFTNAFAATALCNPSRTAFLTGINPLRTRVHRNRDDWWELVDPSLTFPAALRQAGYSVYSYGKVSHGDHEIWTRTGIAEESLHEWDDRATVDAALAAPLREPWLLMVGLINPHEPLKSPAKFYEDYPLAEITPPTWSGDAPPPEVAYDPRRQFARLVARGQLDDYVRGYLANVAEMDYHLGRLLAFLRKKTPRPHVLLTSDHGYHLGDHDAVGKFTLWDEGARAPLVVAAPGGPAGLRVGAVASLLDVAPTFLDWAGLPLPARLDGVPLGPDYVGRGYALTISHVDGATDASLRTRRWRATRYAGGEVELYDQVADPRSADDLSDLASLAPRRRALLDRLDAELRRWRGDG